VCGGRGSEAGDVVVGVEFVGGGVGGAEAYLRAVRLLFGDLDGLFGGVDRVDVKSSLLQAAGEQAVAAADIERGAGVRGDLA
jgi:hypothetical protein